MIKRNKISGRLSDMGFALALLAVLSVSVYFAYTHGVGRNTQEEVKVETKDKH